MHRYAAGARSVSMLDGIGARFTDGNEQISHCPRAGADCRQPPAYREPDIPQRPRQRRDDKVQRPDLAAVLAADREYRDIIVRYLSTHELGHELPAQGVDRAGCHRHPQPLECDVERGAAAVDQPVGVETDEPARRQLDGRRAASQPARHADGVVAGTSSATVGCAGRAIIGGGWPAEDRCSRANDGSNIVNSTVAIVCGSKC